MQKTVGAVASVALRVAAKAALASFKGDKNRKVFPQALANQ